MITKVSDCCLGGAYAAHDYVYREVDRWLIKSGTDRPIASRCDDHSHDHP